MLSDLHSQPPLNRRLEVLRDSLDRRCFELHCVDCFLDVIAFSIGSFEAASSTFRIRPR